MWPAEKQRYTADEAAEAGGSSYEAQHVAVRMTQGSDSLPLEQPVGEDFAAALHVRALEMDRFIHAERPALISYMRGRAATPEDAEEAAQDALMRLLRYQDERPPDAWRFLLYHIAANVLTDRARRAQTHHRSAHVALDDLALPSDGPLPDQVLAKQQELALLRRAVLQLPPKCQHVFLLSRVHGLTYAQIARRCGISVKMVEKHMHKALTVCLERVEQG